MKKLQEAGGFNTDTALDNITKTPDTLDSFKNERAVVEAEYKRINENTKMGSYVKKLEIDKLTKKLEDIQTRYLANTRIDKKPGFEI